MRCMSCGDKRSGLDWSTATIVVAGRLDQLVTRLKEQGLVPPTRELFQIRHGAAGIRMNTFGWLLPKRSVDSDIILSDVTWRLYEDTTSLLGSSRWTEVNPGELCLCSLQNLADRQLWLQDRLQISQRLAM